MGKAGKFANVLSASAPSRAESGAKRIVLQNIIEGEKPEYQYIKIDAIALNPLNDYNETDTEAEIKELAEDIRRNGLLHNIVVAYTNEGTYRLLSGERRLRAYRHLFAETQDEKYASIYALIRKGLSETEEMLILDAANLHVRGGIGDEKKYRKATARFVANLRERFNISDEEAIALTKQYAGVTGAVIDKNIVLERDLHPSLLALLDGGYILKGQAYEYARLPQEVQNIIAQGLDSAKEKSAAEFKKLNEAFVEPAKKIRTLQEDLESQQGQLEEVRAEAKENKTALAQVDDADQEAELQGRNARLKEQEKQYKKAIKKTAREIEDSVSTIAEQAAEGQTADVPSATIGEAAVTAEVLDLVAEAEASVQALGDADLETKGHYIAEPTKTQINKRLNKLAGELGRLARLLK